MRVRKRFGFCANAFFISLTKWGDFIKACIQRNKYGDVASSHARMTRSFHIGADGRHVAWCIVMTTVYDIPADLLMPALADAMAEQDAISMPEWADYVKTAVDRERPPTQSNWWYLRTAAILRKVSRNGPIGATHLAQAFGGKKDNGVMPNTPGVASRHIIRTALQQLEDAGLVEKSHSKTVNRWEKDDDGNIAKRWNEKSKQMEAIPLLGDDGKQMTQDLYSGRQITASGQKLIDAVAHSVRDSAESQYPGLNKY